MADRALTELESVALGCVAHQEPCTAYVVRRQFQESPSARFSASTGAIYPLLQRLEQRGLLRSVAAPTGGRPARAYSITARGRRALVAWLERPLSVHESVAEDPFRTRMMFLGLLDSAVRLHWLDNAERSILEQDSMIAEHEQDHAEDAWLALAHDNAHRMNRARLDWIRAARDVIEDL